MNFDDYESLPTNNVASHMMAGALAGILEHCVMYPLDSVKTRMQSLSVKQYYSIREVITRMVAQEGLMRPIRGVQVVVMGAGPAHALYFSCYEFLKKLLTTKMNFNNHIAYVVKQRLQMYNSPYKTVLETIVKVYKTEGVKAFYRSYTTQLTMNIPFQSIHFMTYELAQVITNPSKKYNPSAHMFSGALAGGVAAAVTTPLDVCKTLLNTQSEGKTRISGLHNAIRMVYQIGGASVFFKGLSARVLYQMPSTAICWSTYEFFKYFLIERRMEDSHMDGTSAKGIELPAISGTGLYGALALSTEPNLLEVTRS